MTHHTEGKRFVVGTRMKSNRKKSERTRQQLSSSLINEAIRAYVYEKRQSFISNEMLDYCLYYFKSVNILSSSLAVT